MCGEVGGGIDGFFDIFGIFRKFWGRSFRIFWKKFYFIGFYFLGWWIDWE